MRWLSKLLALPIRFYRRFISPFLPQTCRYYPTCSQYSIEALERYGPFWGTLKSIARILRCHPLFPGGYDPVEQGWPRVRENKRK